MAAPATPAGLAVDKTASNAVKLSWNNVAGETGFRLYKSYDSGVNYECIVDTETADVLTWYDMDCGAETEYYYKVSAYNADGESAKSVAVSTTTLAKSKKYAWLGTIKTSYDANAIYRRETTTQYGQRSTGSMLVEEVADSSSEVPAFSQIPSAFCPTNAQYVLAALSSGLTDDRVLTAGDAISITDGGANSTITVAVDPAAHVANASESHAITDPADTPASADALRDDLVTNTIPSIESALNALGVKINAIISALETAKLMETV